MKKCTKCLIEKEITEFQKHPFSKGGINSRCKDCLREYNREYRAKNPIWVSLQNKKWRASNPERAKLSDFKKHQKKTKEQKEAENKKSRERYAKQKAEGKTRIRDKEERKRYNKEYLEKNPEKFAYQNVVRKTSVKQSKPSWANEFFMQEAYRLARLRTKVTGIKWHVDHIVPIRGKTVCGLHTDQNLQVIPAAENLKKRHLVWPDMP